MLQWTDDPISIDDHGKFQAETQRGMKENLFKEIIKLFDKGKVTCIHQLMIHDYSNKYYFE